MFDFTTEVSLIWWAIGAFAAGWLVVWIYRSQISVFGKKMLAVLRALRIAAMALLLFLLLRPSFLLQKVEEKPKTLIWVVDHSGSMILASDSSEVRKLPERIEQISQKVRPQLHSDLLAFGSKISENPDFLFGDTHTDGYQWIRHIGETRTADEIAAIVLVSDGIFNTSYSPEFFVHELKVPVYTVGTGDTTVMPDAAVVSVISPKVVLPDTEFEVEILVRSLHLENMPMQVRISGQGVQNGVFSYIPSVSPDSKSFKTFIRAQKPGLYRYVATIGQVQGERNLRNNTYVFYVEVIQERGKILLIDEIKHPDIGILRQYFLKNSQNQLEVVRPDSLRYLTQSFDLAIVHSPAHPETFSYLRRNPKLPVLAVIGFGTDPRALSSLTGTDVVRFSREDRALPIPNETFYKITAENFLYSGGLPPLDVFYAITGLSNTDILAFQKISGTPTTRPLLSLSESQRRMALFHGEGFWKWKNKLQSEGDTTGMDALLLKLTRWLTQEGRREPLEVVIPERVQPAERFVVKAYLYDDSDLPITNAKVNLVLADSTNRTLEYNLISEGTLYTQAVQGLRPGTYRWNVTASLPGKTWSMRGILLVEENDIESYDLVANHDKLRRIAENSGGEFYRLTQLAELEKALSESEFVPQLIDRTNKTKLIEWWPYFILIFILIALEWFLRRYLGSY